MLEVRTEERVQDVGSLKIGIAQGVWEGVKVVWLRDQDREVGADTCVVDGAVCIHSTMER
jgi:hypothetical protein